MPLADLRNKVVWVTGASSGIGAALVPQLAAQGCRVATTARRGELLEELARPLREAGATIVSVPADVADPVAVAGAARRVADELGPVDVAIFNAGINRPHSARSLRAASIEEIFRVNFLSSVHGIEAVLPSMLERKSGHLVGVASLAAYRPLPVTPAYGASKAALQHLLEGIRFTLEPEGIFVTVVNPGFVKTPMIEGLKQPTPAIMTAEAAARRIVAGIRRREREIHFPRRLSWFLSALRVLPYGVYHRLVAGAVRG